MGAAIGFNMPKVLAGIFLRLWICAQWRVGMVLFAPAPVVVAG